MDPPFIFKREGEFIENWGVAIVIFFTFYLDGANLPKLSMRNEHVFLDTVLFYKH